MFRSRTAGFFLAVALVFSQALYAHHDMLHDGSGQANCQTCLQALGAAAALPAGGSETVAVISCPPEASKPVTVVTPSKFPNAHPGRAPPFPSL